MSDKVQLIKQELERIEQILDDFNKTHNNTIDNGIVTAKKNICKHIKSFINSLPEEPTKEDLDFLVISLEETIGTSPHSREVIKEHLQKAAELQKQKDQETIELAEDHAMLAGMNKMKEEMMKDAVETTIVNDWQYGKDPDHAVIPAIHQRIDGFNVGDRVKIVICKTEQQ